MQELSRVDEFLRATVEAAVSVPVYDTLAPRKALVHVVFAVVDEGRDTTGLAGVRILVQPLYVVRAVGRNADYATVKSVADDVDDALHGAVGDQDGVRIDAVIREAPLKYAEEISGVTWRHVGGTYRVTCYAA